MELCRERGLPWVEDPTNLMLTSPRNRFRAALARHPELLPGLADTMALCREAKSSTEPAIRSAMKKMASVDYNHGTVSFVAASYQRLKPYIARSIMSVWLRYVVSTGMTISKQSLDRVHNAVMQERSVPETASKCILIPLPKVGKFMLAKQKSHRLNVSPRVPVRVGETVQWDNRFSITVSSKTQSMCEQEDSLRTRDSRVFYVRNFKDRDYAYLSKGSRKVKTTVLVHPHVRGGLPVIEDEDENVVAIPHFRVMNHDMGVAVTVRFNPVWSMEDLLNFRFISDESSLLAPTTSNRFE